MKKLCGLFVVLAVSMILSAQPRPVPGSQRVKPVFDAADVVCSGRVESLRVLEGKRIETGNGTFLLKRVVASVYVQDSYKANETLPSSILVSFEERAPEVSAAIQKDEWAILFLKHSEDSSYVFADPYMGVTQFADIPMADGESGLTKLESTLAEIVSENDREDKIKAIRLLEGMENLQPGTLAQVASLSASPDPELAFDALATMIKVGVPGSIETLDQYLQGYQGDGNLSGLVNIEGGLNRTRNRKELSALESLASSRFLAIRIGAMEAIRSIGDVSSVPTLIQRLSDSDSNIRYSAVISLAEILNRHGDYKPSMAEFGKRPDFYTNEWQDWWAHEGATFPKPASSLVP